VSVIPQVRAATILLGQAGSVVVRFIARHGVAGRVGGVLSTFRPGTDTLWGNVPRIRAASIDEHKMMTRSALLSAAYSLIEEHGSADFALGEVALSAGVGRTTLYEYFSDRDDVIATLVEEELPGVIEALIASTDANLPVPEQLAELATRTIEFVATDRVYGVILHRDAGKMNAEAQSRIRAAHSQLADQLMSLYMQGVKNGVFRSIPAAVAGRLIQDTVMSGARVVMSGAEDAAVTTAAVRRFLLGGLGHTPSTPV
jgi:AcrR family transcriptional regulator